MTSNQINYLRLIQEGELGRERNAEERRHNKKSETLMKRSQDTQLLGTGFRAVSQPITRIVEGLLK